MSENNSFEKHLWLLDQTAADIGADFHRGGVYDHYQPRSDYDASHPPARPISSLNYEIGSGVMRGKSRSFDIQSVITQESDFIWTKRMLERQTLNEIHQNLEGPVGGWLKTNIAPTYQEHSRVD